MGIRLSAVAALFGATLFSAAAPLSADPAVNQVSATSNEDVTGSIAAPASESDPSLRVDCFYGVARDGTTRHAGWVCRQDTTEKR